MQTVNSSCDSDHQYEMREDITGTWTVYHVQTGMTAEVDGIRQHGLSIEQAADWVDLLNTTHVSGSDDAA